MKFKSITSILIPSILILAVLIGFFWANTSDNKNKSINDIENETAIVDNDKKSKSKLTESDLDQGCPRRDCIPSIDNPKFESVEQANEWLNDDDLVFGVIVDGMARAYPQRILNWHEIVNDTIGDTDFAVTFCPLCGSAISFERQVNGQTTTFGVSGKLFNSNLVMYDRLQENYWQQETGEAIIGEAAERNEKLKPIPMASVFWEQWKQSNPQTEVLSRETGYSRDYDLYPYGAYEEDGELYFGIENSDTRLQIKTPGYGFEIPGYGHKFYQETDLPVDTEIADILGSKNTISENTNSAGDTKVVVKNQGGIVTMRLADGSKIIPIRTFWFAFAAFHPDAEIYNQ